MNIIKEQKQMQQEQLDKLEKEKFKTIDVYTLEVGYYKWSTTNKDLIYKLWQLLSDEFFELAPIKEYETPSFKYKKPIAYKLSSMKENVWKSYEDALKAHNIFQELKSKKINK